MVNKVRKKDGSMKYPYEFVLPFTTCIELVNNLKNHKDINYCYNDNKSYGTYISSSLKDGIDDKNIINMVQLYLPDYEPSWFYPDKYRYISFYIAYAEFDKEV